MIITVEQSSHIGMHRSENQDSMNYVDPADEGLLRGKGRLLVVADGMGGAAGGKTASQTAVSIIAEQYFQNGSEPLESLQHAFEAANREIFRRGQQDPSLRGMGTTATAAAFLEDHIISAHVGDTRLYRLRDHALDHLTVDHSMVAQMVREGLISANDARHHPQRNVLMRSMGVQENLVVDLSAEQIQPNDRYLLCTDGLHGLVEDTEIAEILRKGSPRDACEKLVSLANERGGYDNITVQIATVD